MNNIEHIRDLIVKHLRQEPLTAEQSRQLETWIAEDESNKQLFEDLNNEEKMVDALARFLQVSELTSAANKQAQEIIFPKATVLAMKNPGRWFKYVAAAAVIVMAGVGVFYYFSNNASKQPVAGTTTKPTPLTNDVPAPTGNKTILILDDTTIHLDDAKNGTLVQQGDVQISKQGDQLNYQVAAKQLSRHDVVRYNTLKTERGGFFKLVLPDGTLVWLNAASSIRYPTAFTGNIRKVEVTGECYFEVRGLPLTPSGGGGTKGKMPFIVSINGKAEVEVLGTHFNINAYDNEESIKTTLLEGSIAISRESKAGNVARVIIKPGQQAQCNVREISHPIRVVSNTEVEQVMAWKNGMFLFKRTDFKAVMRQLEMWYDIEVAYEGVQQQTTFSGELQRSMPLSTVLRHLERAHIHFRMEGRRLTVLP